ncbi:MAG: hypothetical protein ACRCX8_14260 [Sarcina sp.]
MQLKRINGYIATVEKGSKEVNGKHSYSIKIFKECGNDIIDVTTRQHKSHINKRGYIKVVTYEIDYYLDRLTQQIIE